MKLGLFCSECQLFCTAGVNRAPVLHPAHKNHRDLVFTSDTRARAINAATELFAPTLPQANCNPCRTRRGDYRGFNTSMRIADPSMTNPASRFRMIARIALGGACLASLAACGGRDRPRADLAAAQITTIGVNSYLWRAALETVSFAPLLQADSALYCAKKAGRDRVESYDPATVSALASRPAPL